MKIASVIVTYNGHSVIERAIQSVARSSVAQHTIVVDNASSDDTVARVRAADPTATIIRLKNNIGFGRANNIGISEALRLGAQHVFLLNQDAYVFDQSIEQLVEFQVAHPQFGLVSPLHLAADETSIDAKTLRVYLCHHAKAAISDALLGTLKPFYPIAGINAAAWMMSRHALETVGGFDPLFFMYEEDDDLLYRLRYHKIEIALLTGSRIVHLRESSGPRSHTFWQRVRKHCVRARAAQLFRCKQFELSARNRVIYLLAEYAARPSIDLVVDRRYDEWLGSMCALWQTARDIKKIARHRAICRQTGPHFLGEQVLREHLLESGNGSGDRDRLAANHRL